MGAAWNRGGALGSDEQGVVERVQFDKKNCAKGIVAVGRWEESRPCIDPAGDDLPLIRQLWQAR